MQICVRLWLLITNQDLPPLPFIFIDYLPIFTREGVSWDKLDKVFECELEEIIHEINTAVAA